MNNQNEIRDFYSLHTFILPFVWKHEKSTLSFEKLCECFKVEKGWHLNTPLEDFENRGKSFSEQDRLFYNEYCYFYPQVQKAIYDNSEDIVRTFSYKPEKMGLPAAKYIIRKGDKTYELQLNGVELKLYSTGIGLFVLKCENRKYSSVTEVKNINEYGRRVILPAILDGDGNLIADSLSLVIGEKEQYESNFSDVITNREIHLDALCKFMEDLLTDSTGLVFTSDKNCDKSDVLLMRALDDRMFVYTYLKDKAFIDEFCRKTEVNGEDVKYEYQEMDKMKYLYGLMFVDPAGDCSCQDEQMCRELVENHLYKRWIDYGSIYSIVPQAAIMMTTGEAAYLVDHFNTIYYQLSCFVLAQRVSLITFQRELTEISRVTKDYKRTKMLLDLRERFSVFEASMYYEEITAQEQGIELYKMFRECLSLEAEMENVKSQINGLSESADIYLDLNFNKIGSVLAIIAAVYSCMEILSGVFQGEDPYSVSARIWFTVGCAAPFVIVPVLFWLCRNRRVLRLVNWIKNGTKKIIANKFKKRS